MYKIKISYHGKCLRDVYLPVAMHQETQSFDGFPRSFLDASQLVNRKRS